MVDVVLTGRRLVAQGLARPDRVSPLEVVRSLGAMQGQDLPGVISSIALRLGPIGSVDDRVAEVTGAFDRGEIVRGYPMRGTVFAVAAADVAWMTELCAGPAVRAQVRRRGQLGLDAEQVTLARDVFERTVGVADRGLAREDLMARWDEAGLATSGGRGYHLLTHLIQSGLAVHGPWNGRDQNVVAAATWLPPGASLAERFGGDERAAVAELLARYLTGHGPATLRDFAWWTKLPLGRIRAAEPLVADRFESDEAGPGGERRYWRPGLADEVAAAGDAVGACHLLPGFDELVLGHPDRLTLVAEEHHGRLVPGNNGVFQKSVLDRGTLVGLWKRAGRPGRRHLELDPFTTFSQRARRRAERAFAAFPHVGE